MGITMEEYLAQFKKYVYRPEDVVDGKLFKGYDNIQRLLDFDGPIDFEKYGVTCRDIVKKICPEFEVVRLMYSPMVIAFSRVRPIMAYRIAEGEEHESIVKHLAGRILARCYSKVDFKVYVKDNFPESFVDTDLVEVQQVEEDFENVVIQDDVVVEGVDVTSDVMAASVIKHDNVMNTVDDAGVMKDTGVVFNQVRQVNREVKSMRVVEEPFKPGFLSHLVKGETILYTGYGCNKRFSTKVVQYAFLKKSNNVSKIPFSAIGRCQDLFTIDEKVKKPVKKPRGDSPAINPYKDYVVDPVLLLYSSTMFRFDIMNLLVLKHRTVDKPSVVINNVISTKSMVGLMKYSFAFPDDISDTSILDVFYSFLLCSADFRDYVLLIYDCYLKQYIDGKLSFD